jgi:hypothetical protein
MRYAVSTILFLLVSTPRFAAFAQTGLQDEIEQLRKQVAAQQEQINELRLMLQEQLKPLAVLPERYGEPRPLRNSPRQPRPHTQSKAANLP